MRSCFKIAVLVGLFLCISCAPKAPSAIYSAGTGIIGGFTTPEADNFALGLLAPVVKITVHLPGHVRESCSGTVVTRDLVLTAAHCLIEPPVAPSKMEITLVVFENGQKRVVTRSVRGYLANPEYKPQEFSQHDVGLLQLDKPFASTDLERPAQLPPATYTLNDFYNYGPFIAAGFGRTNDEASSPSGGLPDMPKYTNYFPGVRAVIYSPDPRETSVDFVRSIIATAQSGSICSGDSGGPLIAYANGWPMVFGVTSSYNLKFETPEMEIEFRVAVGDQAKIKAFNQKYPHHHDCTGTRNNFADVGFNLKWIRKAIATLDRSR